MGRTLQVAFQVVNFDIIDKTHRRNSINLCTIMPPQHRSEIQLNRILSVLWPAKLKLAGRLAVACVAFSGLNLRAAEDILIADFEGDTYGDWKTTGTAFGSGPAHGTLPGQQTVEGFQGKGLVNSFFNGDDSTGTLTSPAFKIARKHLKFLIGGGGFAGKTCMNLLVDGKIIRTATGPNTQPGGSETLVPAFWDVQEFVGQTAVLQIVDNATGGWGHINVDQIVQTDAGLLSDAKKDLVVTRHYLNLPIKNGAAKRNLTLMVDGKVEEKNELELADAQPDWWAFVDVSAWRGKTVTLQVDKLPEESAAFKLIDQGNSINGAENLYREPLRGQFHFSSQRGWINDPNGLVFYQGQYHLFYQHNPYGVGWGNMHWGHAVSPDMVHWRELGDVLAPDRLGAMFSGSAVVDWNNTSGFGTPGHPPLILIYAAAGSDTQCIAFSTDGLHFTKYSGNPVVQQITGGNRDPKVMWFEPTRQWVMVLYVEKDGKHTIHFLTSPNLRDWSLASVTEGGKDSDNFLFECPDFFELPVDGDSAHKKWVLTAANSEYAIGTFDGTKFTAESVKLPGQRGINYYAAQTFSDLPDHRRIQLGWDQTGAPGQPFCGSMTIPHELKLITTPNGPRLTWTPVHELETLRAKSHDLGALTLTPDSANPLTGRQSELLELRAEFEPGNASEVTFQVRGATIRYDVPKQELSVDGHRAPAPLRNGKQSLIIYCDRNGLEAFASDGLIYVPTPFQPKPADLSLGVKASGGAVRFNSLQVYELKSAWDRR